MRSIIQVLDIDYNDGTACVFVPCEVVADMIGLPLEVVTQQMPDIFQDSIVAVGGFTIPFLMENGWRPDGQVEMAACSLNDATGVYAGTLMVLSSRIHGEQTLEFLTPKMELWARRIVSGEVEIEGGCFGRRKVSGYLSFRGSLTEIEDMVVTGLFSDSEESYLYKTDTGYELIVNGVSDSYVASEFLPITMRPEWRAIYNEHRSEDCIIDGDAVSKMLSYCKH